ncbi:MAG: RNA polymerase sigma factor [Ruminococcaceae bacterium]|nr:RNA polymerase sigma factor [Oscillospiraceae bacterium]
MDNGAGSYRRFLDGDDDGFVEIIRDYKDGLQIYLCSITGNVLVAEELTEETFVKIITKKPRFSGKSSFKTWLYTIGRNVAIDFLRKKSRSEEVSLDEIAELHSEEKLLEDAYIKDEEKRELHKALKKLPPTYRQALWLTYFEELSNKETAGIMKKSVHNVETILYRARIALKEELLKEGFVYEGL